MLIEIVCFPQSTIGLSADSPRSLYQNSNLTPGLSSHFSIFALVFIVSKSLLGIARQWSLEKFALLSLKPRSHVRNLMS